MIRKVIQLAGKTLVVSLPLKFAQRNKIQKGDEIEVREQGHALIIQKPKQEQRKTVVMDTRSTAFHIRFVEDLYKKGYDEIIIQYDQPEIAKEVKSIDLLGYEILDEGKQHLTLKNVSKALESEFENMMNKSMLLAKEMIEGIALHVEESKEPLEPIISLEKMNNKCTDFCLRILNKHATIEGRTTFLYVMVREIEKLADEFRKIAEELQKKKQVSKKIKEIIKELAVNTEEFQQLMLKERYKAFLTFHMKIEKKKQIRVDAFKNDEAMIVHHILSAISLLHDLAGPFLTMHAESFYPSQV